VSLPLAERRILVTRATHQAGKLSHGLRALGAEPVEVPLLEIRPPLSFELLDAALRQLDCYDWLMLTSANAVRAVQRRAEGLGLASAASPRRSIQVAAVGEATAAAARDAGFLVTFVPESYVAESLVQGIAEQVAGKRVLLARATMARDVIPDALREMGASVDVVEAYRNVMPEAAPEQLRQALEQGLDAATFTSSSSVTHLLDAVRQAGLAWPLAGVPSISIGPITSQTLRDLGWNPAIEADTFDIPGLLAAVERFFNSQPH
jgi:uroporphyrinogen-III synthase/uroporphyrinogen III methyltransferase/synthase